MCSHSEHILLHGAGSFQELLLQALKILRSVWEGPGIIGALTCAMDLAVLALTVLVGLVIVVIAILLRRNRQVYLYT